MATTASLRLPVPRRAVAGRVRPDALAAWALPFALVTYLGLSGGGYDPVLRGQIGLAVWWLVLLGALLGLVPARTTRWAWAALGLLGGFAAWTALDLAWSESIERSADELARVTTYAGFLALFLAVRRPGTGRHVLNGTATALALLAAAALLSRLHPGSFGSPVTAELLPAAQRRLNWPLNYWNGLAALMAIGVPVLLAAAAAARTRTMQGLAVAAVPVMALTLYFTGSRGGTLALVVGLVAYLALVPDRLARAGSVVVAAAGAAVLIWAATSREPLRAGLQTSAAAHDGAQLLWLTGIVCLGVALLHIAVELAARHAQRPRWLEPPPRRAGALALAGVALAAIVLVAAGAPGAVSRTWRDFKAAPHGAALSGRQQDVFARLQSTNGNGRYQYWQSAWRAAEARRWQGTGPATFELWWARDGRIPGFVRDAHSLYLQTLAESGIPGVVLLGGLLLVALAGGAVRALRAPPERRLAIAGATAGVAAFATSAALDWIWAIPVLPAVLLVLVALALGGGRRARRPAPALAPRLATALVAAAALVAIALPLASATALRSSQDASQSRKLAAAVGDARTAQRVQPYAASPHLQQALVLEQAGALGAAARQARAATAKEPTDWRTWLIRSRILAERGDTAAALRSYRRARKLNPRSVLFAR